MTNNMYKEKVSGAIVRLCIRDDGIKKRSYSSHDGACETAACY